MLSYLRQQIFKLDLSTPQSSAQGSSLRCGFNISKLTRYTTTFSTKGAKRLHGEIYLNDCCVSTKNYIIKIRICKANFYYSAHHAVAEGDKQPLISVVYPENPAR